MSRSRSWCLLGLLLLSLLAPAAAADTARRLSSSSLAPSAAHEVWALAGSTARGHLVRVGPSSPARLRVVPARGGLGGRETVSSICRRTRGCRAAVNGDYFSASSPVGGVVARGRLLRSPSREHEQVSLDPLRATARGFGDGGWTGTVLAPDGTELTVDAVNRGTVPGETGLWTADAGRPTPACSCLEVVLQELDGRAVGVLGKPVRVRAVRRAAGGTSLPLGTSVLAATGAAAQRLAAATDAAAGRPWTVTLATAEPTVENLGAHPVLLRGGRASGLDPADPALRDRHPRTALAWDSAGGAWLGVLDGRQPGGPGSTAPELVRFLRDRGATDAVLLDGGGSSTLATARGPLNRPSDGVERPVANAVVLVWDPPPTASGASRSAARSGTAPAPVPDATGGPDGPPARRAVTVPAPRQEPADRALPPAAPTTRPEPASGAPVALRAVPPPVPAAVPPPADAGPGDLGPSALGPSEQGPGTRVPGVLRAGLQAGDLRAAPVGLEPGPVRAATLLLTAALLSWLAVVRNGVRPSPAPR